MEQLNIFDYIEGKPDTSVIVQKAPERKSRELSQYELLDKKYKLSRKYKDDDGWSDDWHYSEMELPKEAGIYFCASPLSDSKYYNFRYLAWAHKHWWVNVRTDRIKWYMLDEDCFRDRNSIPFAWMEIPDKYQRDDETLHRMYADFVSEDDWQYERLMKAIEQRKKYYFSDDELIVIDEDERFKE